jgi:hypothetical protein
MRETACPTVSAMRRPPFSDFRGPEPTTEELAERKRICDRSALLDHVDYIVRPPPWVYEEIEEAIRHAIAGDLAEEIESRDGHRYLVADLVERWELEEMLDVYRRAPDDPSYPSGHPGGVI